MFDKQIQLRMGEANVKKWAPEIMKLLSDDDPLGVEDFATHRLPLADAPHAYEIFRQTGRRDQDRPSPVGCHEFEAKSASAAWLGAADQSGVCPTVVWCLPDRRCVRRSPPAP